MTFALKQQNVNTLTETLLKVSDPKHTDYGKHLTKGEVDSLIAPLDKTVRHAVPSFTRSSPRQCSHSLARSPLRTRRAMCPHCLHLGPLGTIRWVHDVVDSVA
jgi:hypothetical protein